MRSRTPFLINIGLALLAADVGIADSLTIIYYVHDVLRIMQMRLRTKFLF
jgi:hypothetical protein